MKKSYIVYVFVFFMALVVRTPAMEEANKEQAITSLKYEINNSDKLSEKISKLHELCDLAGSTAGGVSLEQHYIKERLDELMERRASSFNECSLKLSLGDLWHLSSIYFCIKSEHFPTIWILTIEKIQQDDQIASIFQKAFKEKGIEGSLKDIKTNPWASAAKLRTHKK